MAQDTSVNSPSGAGLRRFVIWGGGVVLILAAAAAVWWGWTSRKPDMIAVLQANNRAVGLMEQFKYYKAALAFEKVVEMAPEWLPGKINLGIALMNRNSKETLARARKVFEEVLARDKDNLHAHFCLGIIMLNDGKVNERRKTTEHFEVVTRQDPSDAAAWYWLGKSLYGDSPRSIKCFQRAIQLDRQLAAAYYNLREKLQANNPAAAEAALEEFETLRFPGDDKDTWGNRIGLDYGEMGRYGNVIGRPEEVMGKPRTGPIPRFHRNDKLQIVLARGTKWATRADFLAHDKEDIGKLRARVRERFGGVLVVLDYNGDGKPDLFLVGAVLRNGKVGDLLLRNDGDDKFTDVTAAAGLDGIRPSLGCCVADYDNDGRPDLLITGVGEQHLFRNTGKGKFEDVTAKAGLDKLKTICLGAAFVDLDADGDLDLVIAQYASLDQAASALEGKTSSTGGGLAVFLNIGEALPGRKDESHPITTRFRRVQASRDADARTPAPLLGASVPTVNLALSDLDGDQDVDLLVLADGQAPAVVVNDRVLRFRRKALPEGVVPRATWNGALVLDANRDSRSDLLLVGPGQSPLLLLNQPDGGPADPGKWFQKGAIKSPPLRQAQATDLDLDGWTDVVGLSDKGIPVLLHNDGGRLVHAREALGSDQSWPKDLVALAVADFAGNGRPDLVVWSETKGLQLHVNQGNDNHGLHFTLTGHRRIRPPAIRKERCNSDGIGTKVAAQARDHWTWLENTTLAAGLGQSRQPLFLGMGRHIEAEVVRLSWTDGTLQAELDLGTGELLRIEQHQRRTGSCPILFTWDGERFLFVTDFLGAGSLGESLPEGGHRLPRTEESIKIRADQLKPQSGQYVLKIAEPMDEITYLDRLELVVLDHPAGVAVYPDERFTENPLPSQQLLAFDKTRRLFPDRAVDHGGRDVTRAVLHRDRVTVDNFAHRSWIGFAEEHWLALDFGKQLRHIKSNERLFLCLDGWTDYPYPESIWAARQAGVALQPPVLERLWKDGNKERWEPLVTAAGKPIDAGFPAGLPRTMTLEVTGLIGKDSRQPLCGANCVLRLRTNMEIYWDRVFLAPLQSAIGNRQLRATCLEVNHADLAVRGMMQEFSPDGRQPTMYDYDRVERVPVSRLSGRMTRYGKVTELLRDRDDCFVIFGPGDVLTVKFDARKLPELPRGWQRSFVLRTWGYCKDSAPFTATGDTVEPLPFQKMSTYPYGSGEHYPRTRKHDAYRREYNTRRVGPRQVTPKR